MKEAKAIKKALSKRDERALVSILVNGLAGESGENFFQRVVASGNFLDPFVDTFESDLEFILNFFKNFSPGIDSKEMRDFSLHGFPQWLQNYTHTGKIIKEIKDQLPQLPASKEHPLKLLLQIMVVISKKCLEIRNAQVEQQNPLEARLKTIIPTINADATVVEIEHVLFDSLNMLATYLFWQAKDSPLWADIKQVSALTTEDLNVFINYGQLWEGWRDLWSKMRLGFSNITFVSHKYLFLPREKNRFLNEKVAEVRLERSTYEISMHAFKMLNTESAEAYYTHVAKIASTIRSSASIEKSWLTTIDGRTLKELYSKRRMCSVIKRIATEMAFHDCDFRSLIVDEVCKVSAEEVYLLFEYLEILWELFCEAFPKDSLEKENEINYLIWFSNDDWTLLFKDIFKNPKALLDIATFDHTSKKGLDVFSCPFLRIANDHFVAVPYLFGVTKFGRVLEEHLNTSAEASINGKKLGDSFEIAVIDIFKEAGFSALGFKRDDIEFDCLAYADGIWFLVETKRTSTVSSPENSRRALSQVEVGITQVRKRLSYLLSDKGKKAIQGIPELKHLPPIVADNIIGMVCTNVLKYSARCTNDRIIISDFSLLRRYIQNIPYTIEEMNFVSKEFRSKVISKPRSGGVIKKTECYSYFLDPEPIRLLLKCAQERIIPFIRQVNPPEELLLFDVKFEDPALIRHAKSHSERLDDE